MTELNNKVNSKLKFYTDNTPALSPIVPNNILNSNVSSNWDPKVSFSNLHPVNSKEQSIDRSKANQPKKQEYSSVLLDRQFSPAIFNTATDIESDLIKPTDCTAAHRINYKIDDVSGMNSSQYSWARKNEVFSSPRSFFSLSEKNGPSFDGNDDNKISLKNAYDLLISEDEHLKLSQKFGQSCGQRKKTLDYSDYQTPPRKSEGFGFGNPSDYSKTYLGQDTRAYTNQNAREIDLTARTMTPPETLRINYSNLPYEWETREGVTTRTFKKMITNFQ